MTDAPPPAGRRRRSPITANDRAAFLGALAAGWSVKNAAERTKHPRQVLYELRERDEAFAAEWAEAWNAGTATLEDEARRRAVDGFDESTYNAAGELIRRVHRYSDPLLHRLLAARDPGRWSTGRVELTGPAGAPLQLEHSQKLTLEAALVLVAERRERAGISTPLGLPAADASGEGTTPLDRVRDVDEDGEA